RDHRAGCGRGRARDRRRRSRWDRRGAAEVHRMKRVARLLLVVAALVAAAPTSASAAGASTAVVVIDTGSSVRSAVIHFDGSINGIDALELAGGNPTT